MADTKNIDSKPAPSTGTSSNVNGVEDRVVMASRHPDGTPAQSAGFEFIGDPEAALAGAVHQLRSVEYAKLQTTVDDAPTAEDNEKAAARGEKRAVAEVNERHPDAKF